MEFRPMNWAQRRGTSWRRYSSPSLGRSRFVRRRAQRSATELRTQRAQRLPHNYADTVHFSSHTPVKPAIAKINRDEVETSPLCPPPKMQKILKVPERPKNE